MFELEHGRLASAASTSNSEMVSAAMSAFRQPPKAFSFGTRPSSCHRCASAHHPRDLVASVLRMKCAGMASPNGVDTADVEEPTVATPLAAPGSSRGESRITHEHVSKLEREIRRLQNGVAKRDTELSTLTKQLADLQAGGAVGVRTSTVHTPTPSASTLITSSLESASTATVSAAQWDEKVARVTELEEANRQLQSTLASLKANVASVAQNLTSATLVSASHPVSSDKSSLDALAAVAQNQNSPSVGQTPASPLPHPTAADAAELRQCRTRIDELHAEVAGLNRQLATAQLEINSLQSLATAAETATTHTWVQRATQLETQLQELAAQHAALETEKTALREQGTSQLQALAASEQSQTQLSERFAIL